MDNVETRVCRICGVTKPIGDFPQLHGKPRGNKCKSCKTRHDSEVRRNNPAVRERCRFYAIRRQNERKMENRAKYLLDVARKRAEKLSIPFNITEEDLHVPKICPVLGIPISTEVERSDNSPSLDKIENIKGYVKGNVRVISWRANRLKSDSTLEEMKKIVEYMERETGA